MMINQHHRPQHQQHQQQPVANVLGYSGYMPPRASLRAEPSSRGVASMFSGYPGMQAQMFAPSEYAHLVQHQHQLQQQATAAAGYLNQSFRRVDHHHPLNNNNAGIHHHQRGSHQQPLRQHRHNMAYTPQMNEDEFAEMQKLSEGWEPEVKGPLVGPRQTSAAIAEEYATADPVYQQKTAALPKTFSNYRTVRGDGRCGWRAIGFAFLEKLILINDTHKLIEQEARIRSLSNVINAAGYAPMVYEDFADELFDFMRSLGDGVRAGNAETVLLDGFNNEAIQSAIITHLRTLTASWMKTHPEEYINYTPDLSIDRYVNDSVLPYGSEIDHVGLSALNDVLLAPAGIGLEVLYLDLTPGPEVNLHNFTRSEQLGCTDSCVRLLYRPGHYDLLYKIEDVPPPAAPISTYLQLSQTYNEPIFDLPTAEFMTMVPGMSLANRQHGWLSSSSYGGGLCDFAPTPSLPQPCATTMSTPAPSAPVEILRPSHAIEPQDSYAPHSAGLSLSPLATQELALRPAPVNMMPASAATSNGPFRQSPWMLKPDNSMHATSQMTLQTSIFRNSHFNTAHFLNPDFQPEEWSPDAEYGITASKAKHKPSG